ncbi:hypothetical protein OSTOST_00112 [Ostertagia ostertagi]
MLRTATFAKEKILSFTQRFMLFDSIFRMLVYTGKVTEKRLNEWGEDKTHDVKQLKAKVEYQLRMLDRHISDIEEEFTRAEKRILNEKVENTSSFVDAFNRAVEKMEKTLLDAISQITNRDTVAKRQSECGKEAVQQRGWARTELLQNPGTLGRRIHAKINRRKEDQEKGVETKKEQQGERQKEQEEQLEQERENNRRKQEEEERQMEIELEELYSGRYLLSQRKIGDGEGKDVTCSFCGRFGRHYSDSCADIVRGDERRNFILGRNMCRHCLGPHESEHCRATQKSCWYCDIVRNTALRFFVEHDGHHRALRKIPTQKIESQQESGP